MSKAPILSVRGLTRTYNTAQGGLTVLKGVDLDVYPGELVGLIGPSGSGKSSLLHAAGLLEKPTSGTVAIDGEQVGDLDERARTRLRLGRIGFVYQFHHLLPEFDARDNVALPMRIAGVAQDEARKRAEVTLTALGLGERLTHQPAQLSGGEQQRVAIGRALFQMAVLQGEDAVHMAGQLHIVGGDQGGDTCVLGEVAQGFEHRLAGGRIQVAGRFVGQQQTRPVGQGAGDSDALTLPA